MTFSLFQQRSLFLGPTHLKGGVIDDSATACGARSLGRVYQPPEMPANSWCSALELHLTTTEEEDIGISEFSYDVRTPFPRSR
jgi:hypothetical protein